VRTPPEGGNKAVVAHPAIGHPSTCCRPSAALQRHVRPRLRRLPSLPWPRRPSPRQYLRPCTPWQARPYPQLPRARPLAVGCGTSPAPFVARVGIIPGHSASLGHRRFTVSTRSERAWPQQRQRQDTVVHGLLLPRVWLTFKSTPAGVRATLGSFRFGLGFRIDGDLLPHLRQGQ